MFIFGHLLTESFWLTITFLIIKLILCFRLDELEAELVRLGPLGATVDVIEEQQEVILDALKKLSKYNHHVQLFSQVSFVSLSHIRTFSSLLP